MPRQPLNRVRLDYKPHPLRFYRPLRLARLLGVNASTVWRWTRDGVLPPPVQLGPGVRGWTEDRLKEFLEAKRREAQ